MRYSMFIVALPLTTLMAGPSFAASFVLCQAPDKEDIVIEQDAASFGEYSLTCISGGGFVADMTSAQGVFVIVDPGLGEDFGVEIGGMPVPGVQGTAGSANGAIFTLIMNVP